MRTYVRQRIDGAFEAYWVYADQGARPYFFGSDCTLCKSPWIDIQRKNAEW